MEDFHNLSKPIHDFQDEIMELESACSDTTKDVSEQDDALRSMQERLSALFSTIGVPIPLSSENDSTMLTDINHSINKALFELKDKTAGDSSFDLNKVDVLMACLAGGIAVLADFIIVRIPKGMKIGDTDYKGSPLTAMLKKIGVDENGNEAKWVRTLEKWFHVDYDKSISDNIPGMYPKNHRAYSLAHDSGIIGLIWGIKDIICGTFSYIDKAGVLHIDKVAPADMKKILYAPMLWLGHIISDMFTKQGIPIPGTCVLRTLKIGSIGKKNRTIGDIVEYMYVQGYDIRHLASTAICNMAIEIVIKIYMFFIATPVDKSTAPLFEQEYIRVQNEKKKRKLLFLAYSIAVAGNIGKVAAYQGSPLAINVSIWCQFAKEAISQVVINTNESNLYINAIENRHAIDKNFDSLFESSEC